MKKQILALVIASLSVPAMAASVSHGNTWSNGVGGSVSVYDGTEVVITKIDSTFDKVVNNDGVAHKTSIIDSREKVTTDRDSTTFSVSTFGSNGWFAGAGSAKMGKGHSWGNTGALTIGAVDQTGRLRSTQTDTIISTYNGDKTTTVTSVYNDWTEKGGFGSVETSGYESWTRYAE